MNEPENHPVETKPVSSENQSKQAPPKNRRLLVGIILTPLIIVIVLAAWMYLPVLQSNADRTPSHTPLPPTASSTQTLTPTVTASPTATPLPSPTLLPPSAFEVNPSYVYPPVPGSSLSAVVLNEDLSVTVDPPFDHPQWYSAEQISQQTGVIITEPYFATIGSGSAVWQMDLPLQPGLYEVFILDTLYSSAGSLDFSVFLGEQELFPLLGIQHLQYGMVSGVPSQSDDMWRSIGLYELNNQDLLSIKTAWEVREMETIVAIDRALIVKRHPSIRDFISMLPANSPKFVVDDSAARIETDAVWFVRNDLPSWGDEFQFVVNPAGNSQVTWQVPGRVPPGTYEVWVWAPEMDGDADILYKVLVNGMENQGAVVVSTSNMPANQWVSLGTWEVQVEPNILSTEEGFLELGLRLVVPQGSQGQIAIDAAAFIYRE